VFSMRLTDLIITFRRRSWLLGGAASLGSIVCLLLAAPATPLALGAEAKASRDLVLTGQVGGGSPVVVRLSPNGRMVKRITASLWLECASGGGFTVTDSWVRLRVRGGSRISASFRNSSVEEGTEFAIADSLRARINPRRTRITGTWRFTIDSRDIATGETDQCDSGAVRFSARR
jgi:hypothetical protein